MERPFFHWVKLVKIISVHLLFVQVLMRSSVKAIAFANVLGFLVPYTFGIAISQQVHSRDLCLWSVLN